MWLNLDDDRRTAPRAAYEMLARARVAGTRATLMLKDLSPTGARIDGVAGLRHGDGITLMLPGLQPKSATVVWLRDASAGIEFDRPLHPDIFRTLVRTHARRAALAA